MLLCNLQQYSYQNYELISDSLYVTSLTFDLDRFYLMLCALSLLLPLTLKKGGKTEGNSSVISIPNR